MDTNELIETTSNETSNSERLQLARTMEHVAQGEGWLCPYDVIGSYEDEILSLATQASRIPALEAEVAAAREALHNIASYIEPHYLGAGEKAENSWLFNEIVSRGNKMEDLYDERTSLRSQLAASQEREKAEKARLDAIQDTGWEIQVACDLMEDGDPVFIIIEHYMQAPHRRELARNLNLRAALDDAMKVDPYSVTKEALSPPSDVGSVTDTQIVDWLEKNKGRFECTSDSSDFVIFLPESRGSGPRSPFFNQTIRQAVRGEISRGETPTY